MDPTDVILEARQIADELGEDFARWPRSAPAGHHVLVTRLTRLAQCVEALAQRLDTVEADPLPVPPAVGQLRDVLGEG
jgi:hypothetical protein